MRKPLHDATAEELHRELVTDFVRGVHAQDEAQLARFLSAIKRIADEWHVSPERVYQEIRGEAAALIA